VHINVDHGGGRVTADLDTRSSQPYAPTGGILPDAGCAMEPGRAVDARSELDGFARARGRFDVVVGWLSGEGAGALTHAELEDRLEVDARELFRQLLQDHLDLRAVREERIA